MLTKNQSTDKQKEGHKREKIKEKAINILIYALIVSICCSIAKSCPTLSDPMDYSTPDSSVLYYVPKFVQIHDHQVSDSI